MIRNIPGLTVAVLAGATLSLSSGYLIAEYVTSGIVPTYHVPRVAASEPVRDFIDDNWPAPSYATAGSGAPLPD